MSWAGPQNRWCTGTLKIRVLSAYLKELKHKYEIIEYVGIAADEPKRIKNKCYPLVEWGMTEKTVLLIVTSGALIGEDFMKYFLVYLAGAARFNRFPSCESYMSISQNYGNSLRDGTNLHGGNLEQTIR